MTDRVAHGLLVLAVIASGCGSKSLAAPEDAGDAVASGAAAEVVWVTFATVSPCSLWPCLAGTLETFHALWQDGEAHVLGTTPGVGDVNVNTSPGGEWVPLYRGEESFAVASTTTGRVREVNGHYRPRWSPDGERLAYMLGSALVLARGDGGDAVTVHEEAGWGDPSMAFPQFDWSPDSEKVLWVGASRMLLTDAASGETVPLSDEMQGGKYPTFSPDGRWLAVLRVDYVKDANGAPVTGSTPAVVAFDRLDGSAVREVPVARADGSKVAVSWLRGWSADSTRVAVRGGQGTWLVGPDGADAVELGGPGVWSPTRSEIAVVQDYGTSLAVVASDGSSAREVAVADPAATLQDPSWSRDGSLLVYQQFGGDGPPGRCRVIEAADGTEVRTPEGTSGCPMFGPPPWASFQEGNQVKEAASGRYVSRLAYATLGADSQVTKRIATPDSIWLENGRIAYVAGHTVVLAELDGSSEQVLWTGMNEDAALAHPQSPHVFEP